MVVALLTPDPTISTALWIIGGLTFAWLSDGPFKGRRWPFIYIGAIMMVSRQHARR